MTMPVTGPLTSSSRVIAQRLHRIIFNNRAQLGFLGGVWFGDQRMLPRTPSVCIEPGIARRDLSGAQNRTLNEIDTIFLIYHSPVSEQQNARRETIEVAENLVRYLERNHLRLYTARSNNPEDQLTIHGHAIEVDPGFAAKQNTLYHAVQVTWRSTTKTWLQQP
jgi:hypothetical protein